ncbi:hypothetical protein DIPPA_00281 [Diplonema papillatum]|nr:hypothetical protein DIPPA_00281 [Diplonema papillatum]|eukprot:gene12130-18749_t
MKRQSSTWLQAAGALRDYAARGELSKVRRVARYVAERWSEQELQVMLGVNGCVERACFAVDGTSRGVFRCGITGVFVTGSGGYDASLNKFRVVRLNAGIGGKYGLCSREANPLHFALVEEHWDVVKYLLRKGADPALPAACGATPQYMSEVNRTPTFASLVRSYHAPKPTAEPSDHTPGSRPTPPRSRRRDTLDTMSRSFPTMADDDAIGVFPYAALSESASSSSSSASSSSASSSPSSRFESRGSDGSGGRARGSFDAVCPAKPDKPPAAARRRHTLRQQQQQPPPLRRANTERFPKGFVTTVKQALRYNVAVSPTPVARRDTWPGAVERRNSTGPSLGSGEAAAEESSPRDDPWDGEEEDSDTDLIGTTVHDPELAVELRDARLKQRRLARAGRHDGGRGEQPELSRALLRRRSSAARKPSGRSAHPPGGGRPFGGAGLAKTGSFVWKMRDVARQAAAEHRAAVVERRERGKRRALSMFVDGQLPR